MKDGLFADLNFTLAANNPVFSRDKMGENTILGGIKDPERGTGNKPRLACADRSWLGAWLGIKAVSEFWIVGLVVLFPGCTHVWIHFASRSIRYPTSHVETTTYKTNRNNSLDGNNEAG